MAFSSKLNKHFHNPAIMRQHERDSEAPKPGARNVEGDGQDGHVEGEHGAVHKSEHFHPEHPENPSPGKHHVVLHHEDGHEAHSDHASAEEAHGHIAEHADAEHTGEDIDDVAGDMAGAEGVSSSCPKCGGAMIDGKCDACGYEDGGGHGAHEEEGGDADVD